MQKWRRRHTNPTLPDITDSLRKLQFNSVLKKIEVEVLGIDPFANSQSMYKTLGSLKSYTPVELQNKAKAREKLPALTGSRVHGKRAKQVNNSFDDSAIAMVSTFNSSFKSTGSNTSRRSEMVRVRRHSGDHVRISVTPASLSKRRRNKFDTTSKRGRSDSRRSSVSSVDSRDSARSVRQERSFLDTPSKRVRNSMVDHITRYRKSRESPSPSPGRASVASGRKSSNRNNKSMMDLSETLRSRSLIKVLGLPSSARSQSNSGTQKQHRQSRVDGSRRSEGRSQFNTSSRSLDTNRSFRGRSPAVNSQRGRSPGYQSNQGRGRYATPVSGLPGTNSRYSMDLNESKTGRSRFTTPGGGPPNARHRSRKGNISVRSLNEGGRRRPKAGSPTKGIDLVGAPVGQYTTRRGRLPDATRVAVMY